MTMSRSSHRLAVGASAVVLLAGIPAAGAQAGTSAPAAAASTTCTLPTPFRAHNFSEGLEIDNRFLPMRPGTRLTYRGQVTAGGTATGHEVVFTVTDLYKVVDGVRSRVIYDVDKDAGTVAEAELAFFAQDDKGNVWNVGEYPEEYTNGKFTGAPSTWIAGQAHASAGIHMLAQPTDPAQQKHEYLQGRAPTIQFLDCAQVASSGGTVRVPVGRFTHVVTTEERSPLESLTAIQLKKHAPGVGIVSISAKNDPQAETLQLADRTRLTAAQLAQVDRQALALDRRAYRVSSVYGATTRARVG
jgi:hypothetical protein